MNPKEQYESFLNKVLRKTPEELTANLWFREKQVFFDPKGLGKEFADKRPFSAGIFLGEAKQRFRATPALIERMAKFSDKKVIVDEKASWLFVCGKDIFGQGVLEGEPEKGKFAFVYNEQNENLGLGFWTEDALKKNGVAIKNILDRGAYLRREMK